ncbi:MAG: PD-(D/E)XK nuclease family protein [Sporomusaceae bacterium]|jgi:hypothetical protein|nr:PD-(D/E)XK nuclease family protein [Sporomusaceae bacterium]
MSIQKGTKTAALFQSMKKDNLYVVGRLDKYLTDLAANDADRAFNVNAPSQIGKCSRAIFYGRMGVETDSNFIDPRTRRIFDNGSFMHTRIQGYLSAAEILLMEEVPVRNDEYEIQGHTDGIILLDERTKELGVLELKSINDGNFKDLTDAKSDHKMQGLVYLFCLEERRKKLQSKYVSKLRLTLDSKNRTKYYMSLYEHLQDGNKFSRAQKLNFKISQHDQMDKILFGCKLPITKAVIIYENKNDQSLKEYVVDSTKKEQQNLLRATLEQCEYINACIQASKAPGREGKNKSDSVCRWCNFRIACWG